MDPRELSHEPDNLFVTASHGSYELSSPLLPYYSTEFKDHPDIQRDYSDWVTGILVRAFRKSACAQLHRSAGDPNRPCPLDDKFEELFRLRTFGGVHVFQDGILPPKDVLEQSLALGYHPFHAQVQELATQKHSDDPSVPIIGVELHDTGIWKRPTVHPEDVRSRLELDGWQMPLVCLHHGGGLTASSALVKSMQDALAEALKIGKQHVEIENPKVGKTGHVTRHYGNPRLHAERKPQHPEIGFVQIEFSRQLYMPDEVRQIADTHAIDYVKNALHKALTAVAYGFRGTHDAVRGEEVTS